MTLAPRVEICGLSCWRLLSASLSLPVKMTWWSWMCIWPSSEMPEMLTPPCGL